MKFDIPNTEIASEATKEGIESSRRADKKARIKILPQCYYTHVYACVSPHPLPPLHLIPTPTPACLFLTFHICNNLQPHLEEIMNIFITNFYF